MGGGLGRVTKHHDYYLSDGSVSFLTGNTLFRVHQSFFERESDIFRDLFARAAEEDPQSGTDARPFTLDVKPDEFAQILWIWYDKEYSYQEQTKANWNTILRLSTRWRFPKIKELAIRELDVLGLSPAERIAIYNEHGIDDDRLLNSYVEICKSPTVPTEEEGRLMQMETLINVLQAREDARRKESKLRHESPTSAGLEDETLREIVSRFFKTGLNPRSNGGPTGSEVQALRLNGEHIQEPLANPIIILGEPQVPDRKAQPSGSSPHANGPCQTGEQRNPAGSGNKQETVDGKLQAEEDKVGLAKALQDKERLEKEKLEQAQRAKEREERESVEKERAEREKEEWEKQQRARQAKEKEDREWLEKLGREKEKGKKPEDQKRPESPLRKAWGKH